MSFRNALGVFLVCALPVSLALGPRPASPPRLEGVVVPATVARLTFSISNDFKRDSLNRLFLYPGDTAIVTVNAYNDANVRQTTSAFRWNAENYRAIGIKGTYQGSTVTIVALQPDSVARLKVTWLQNGMTSYLTIRTYARVSVSQDTLTARVAFDPSVLTVKANDSTIIRIRAWNAQGIELFGKKSAKFEFVGDSTDLKMRPFGSDPQARWVIAGPCPMSICTTPGQQNNAYLRQTPKGMRWALKTPSGWQELSTKKGD